MKALKSRESLEKGDKVFKKNLRKNIKKTLGVLLHNLLMTSRIKGEDLNTAMELNHNCLSNLKSGEDIRLSTGMKISHYILSRTGYELDVEKCCTQAHEAIKEGKILVLLVVDEEEKDKYHKDTHVLMKRSGK